MNFLTRLFAKQYQILLYLPEAVLLIDADGKVRYSNRLANKIFEVRSLVGKNINDFFITSSENIIQNSEYDEKQVLKIISGNNNTKIADVKVADFSTSKRKQYVLTVADNTNEHTLLDNLLTERQESRIIDRTKNGLIVKMKNNLCSPLNSIVGFSQAMLEGLSGPLNEKQEKYLSIINTNSSEILLFLNKLTELSQVESNLIEYEFGQCNVVSIMNVVSNEYRQRMKDKGLSLFVETDALVRSNCYTDKNILKNVLSNLLENALLAQNNGKVTVRLSNPSPDDIADKIERKHRADDKSYLMVELMNTGDTVTANDALNMFDPYLQVDKNSKKHLLQSLILGATKKFISKLNGEIWAEAKALDEFSLAFVIPIEKELVEEV